MAFGLASLDLSSAFFGGVELPVIVRMNRYVYVTVAPHVVVSHYDSTSEGPTPMEETFTAALMGGYAGVGLVL